MNILGIYGVELVGIANYELIKNGRWYTGDSVKSQCPYTDGNKWHSLPSDMLVIYDEFHRCKNAATKNAQLSLTLRNSSARVLLLTATLADKVEYYGVPLTMIGKLESPNGLEDYINEQQENSFDEHISIVISRNMKQYVSRMTKDMIDNDIPNNYVHTNPYRMSDKVTETIKNEAAYAYMNELKYKYLGLEETTPYPIVRINRARQRIEIAKCPYIVELVEKYYFMGKSIVIFLNFKESMGILRELLNNHNVHVGCFIHGGQNQADKQENINVFQSGKERVIMCQMQSGGTGISLHDTTGEYPRVSIISPSWSSQDLMQALGRIHRAGAKTPATQLLIYCKDTVEEQIAESLNDKIYMYNAFHNAS